MERKVVSGIMLALLHISLLTFAFNIYSVKAEPTTWYVDDDGGADFTKIQDAIYAASPGDTIYVYNGTYYEHVTIDKSISLIGENPRTTIIDCGGKGTVVYVTADNVIISRFTMQNSHGPSIPPDSGIHIHYSHNVTIRSNRVTNNALGIYAYYSDGCSIIESNVSNNGYAIILRYSDGCTVRDNIASNNFYFGINLHHCSRSIVSNNNLSNNGIQGILLEASDNNIIYHNNFINNYYQVYSYSSVNTWDDSYPSGGNYWSDYTDVDEKNGPGQDLPGSDGIWDHPYEIDANNKDNYPLVEPWSPKPTDPLEALEELIETLQTEELPKGTESSLSAKLKGAIHLMSIGNENGAIHKLMGFINQVEAQRGKKLTDDQADYLTTEAQRIIDLIEE